MMTKSDNSLVSKQKPLQQMRRTTLLASGTLTRLEIDALRQKKKHISDYYQKELSKTLLRK